MLKQSSFIGFIDPILGLELAEKGIALLEPQRDPHLDLVGRHLMHSGRMSWETRKKQPLSWQHTVICTKNSRMYSGRGACYT